MSQPSQSSQLVYCRDESCPIIELHRVRGVCLAAARERLQETKLEGKSRSKRPPWRRPAPDVLDDVIVEIVSPYVPKQFKQVLEDVVDNYGEIAPSKDASAFQLHWHLRSLIQLGRIARVEVSKQLFVYLRAGSRLISDLGFIQNFVEGIDPPAQASSRMDEYSRYLV